MWLNIEKGEIWNPEKSCVKVWDIPEVADAEKKISDALGADGQDIEKSGIEKRHLWSLMDGHFTTQKARDDFCGRYGKNQSEEVEVEEFEEKIKDYKEKHFGMLGIIYY